MAAPESRRPVVPPPVAAGRDTRARRAAREALVEVLWDAHGQRRLPGDAELCRALLACDRRDVWWVCEANSAGPLYLLPTRPWLRALSTLLTSLKVRRVLEVAAGDGFLSAGLRSLRPDLEVVATDDFSWTRPARRMNAADRAEFAGVDFAGIRPLPLVLRMGAVAAVKRFKPDLVLVSWAPPGTLVERVIRAPSRLVLDLGVDGDVCGNGSATWRFEKEFLEGPVATRALCRMDSRPTTERATRATLYFGRSHPQFQVATHSP